MPVRSCRRPRRTLVAAAALAMVAVPLSPAAGDPDGVQIDPADVERHLSDIEIDPEELQVDPDEVEIDGPSSGQLRDDRVAVEARLDEIAMRIAAVVEEYNVAMVALEDIQEELSLTEAELSELGAEAEVLGEAAVEHVRRIHKLGPSLELSALFVTENPTDAGAKSATLRRVLTTQRTDLEMLAATRTAVGAAEDRLAVQEADAQQRAEAVEARRQELEATIASFEDEIAELEQEIAEAEAAEQAELRRLEEERRREAEARARREAERRAFADAEERARREAEERARREAEAREAAEREAAERAAAERDAEQRAAAQREAEQRAEREAAQRAAAEREAANRSSGSSGSGSSGSGSSSSGSGGSGSSGSSGSGSSSSGGSGSSGGGSSDAPPSTRRSAQVAVDTALAQVGKPYQWGATGPNSFDCSGLTSFAWRAAGVTIPRTSGAQYSGLTKVSRSQLQPGDLVFYNSPISHVAMYVGGDTIVEAPYTGALVRTRSLSNRTPVGYARP